MLHSKSTKIIRVFYSLVRSMTAILYHVHYCGQNIEILLKDCIFSSPHLPGIDIPSLDDQLLT